MLVVCMCSLFLSHHLVRCVSQKQLSLHQLAITNSCRFEAKKSIFIGYLRSSFAHQISLTSSSQLYTQHHHLKIYIPYFSHSFFRFQPPTHTTQPAIHRTAPAPNRPNSGPVRPPKPTPKRKLVFSAVPGRQVRAIYN